MPQRRRLAWSGAVSIALALSEKGEIVSEPDEDGRPAPAQPRPAATMEDLIADAALADAGEPAPAQAPRPRRGGDRHRARRALDRQQPWGKKPVCQVIVLVV